MIEKQLPIYDAPIAGLQFFPLNILFNEPKIMPWFYCNYIQLEWLEDWCITFSLLQENFVGIPFLDKQILIRDTITNISVNPIEFLISNTNLGWYTQICLDEYYIPHKLKYQKEHYIHDNLVSGYNLDKKCFTLFGYDDTYKLNITEAGFDEVKESFHSLSIRNKNLKGSMEYFNLIALIRKNQNEIYHFDINCLIEMLTDYLEANDYSLRFKMIRNKNMKKTYGIDIYDKLSQEFTKRNRNVVSDIRLINTIYEHKKVMTMRVSYLMDNNILIKDKEFYDQFIKMEEDALILKNMNIKYLLSQKENLCNQIAQLLLQLKNDEISLLKKLIVMLRKAQ